MDKNLAENTTLKPNKHKNVTEWYKFEKQPATNLSILSTFSVSNQSLLPISSNLGLKQILWVIVFCV